MRLTIFILFLIALTAVAKAQPKTVIENKIRAEAARAGLDADLAVAIATVESGLNPKAVGSLKEQGLFQLRPEFHRLTGTVDNNVKVAIRYLIEVKKISAERFGVAWFVSYNYGPYSKLKHPQRTLYFKKVMNELSKIKVNRYLIAAQ